MITIFKNVTQTQVGFVRSVDFALERIKSGAVKDKIEQIRQGNKELKKTLSIACFNGTFENRSEAGLIEHSGFCILDFDKFDADGLKTWRDTLEANEYIYACWLSPSGNGLKALVKIPAEAGNHRLYFKALVNYFDCDNLDLSGSDISRPCFESYDPDLYINTESKQWTQKGEQDFEDIGTQSPVIPLQSESIIVENLKKWWNNRFGMIEGNRNNNVYVLAMAFNEYGVNQTVAEQILQDYQQEDFKLDEINKVIKSAYKNKQLHGTRFFEDHTTRKNVERDIRTGKTEAEILKKYETVDDKTIESIKDNLSDSDFWRVSKKGAVSLVSYKFKYWLEQNNIHKFYPSTGKTFTFIKKDQNILDETDEKRIKDFVLSDLLKREKGGLEAFDFMSKSTKYFSSDFLSFLDTAEVNIKEDTQNECFIYFQNCVVEVTKDSIRQIDYIDINGFVWRRQIIERDFNKCDHHDAVFRSFLWKIADENVERYNSLKSVIGYLLHTYKTSANNRAIILNDETISDNPNGGSGKGLFWNAISKMKRVASIDGKTFDFGKSFPYQTVSTDTQILVFDDVKKNFNFESLFSLITEGITLEYKGKDAIKLPVQQSPKILITTNYTVGGNGGSFDRRKFEVEFSGYFNSRNTPLDEFGHLFFDEWDRNEWDRFDSFMLQCVQYYLQNGLVEADFKNLPLRKLIKKTSQEFVEWMNENPIKFNERESKKDAFDNFLAEYPDYQKWNLSRKRFIIWLKNWCDHYNYEFDQGNTNGFRWLQITTDDVQPAQDDINDLPF